VSVKDPRPLRTVPAPGRAAGGTTVPGIFGSLGLLMGLFATVALVVAAMDWRDETAQAHWPLVSALIERGEVAAYRRETRDGDRMRWQLDYRVRFDLAGQEQIASITLPSATSSAQGAELQSWAARHRRGDHIEVRYDPAHPSRAVFASAGVPNAGSRTHSDLVLVMAFAMASVGLLALAKHLASEESRELSLADSDSPSLVRIALGVVSIEIGLVLAGIAVSATIHATDRFTSEVLIAVPAGLIFVFGGILLAMRPGNRRWQAVLSALLVTCFAVTFDWVALALGEGVFGGGSALGPSIGAELPVGEFLGRAAFGVAAIVLDIFAVIVWIRHWRGIFRPDSNSDTGNGATG